MNTFLLKDDNTIQAVSRSTVMEKSNCIEDIEFITKKIYNGYDMAEFDLVLEYKTPITHSVRLKTLELFDSDYKDEYYKYKLPSETKTITGESGQVEMNLSFMKVEIDPDGKVINHVRNFTPTFLNIVPLSSWFTVSDEGMSQIAELYLANKSQIEALSQIASQIYDTKADDIGIDEKTNKLRTKSNGKYIGTGISVEELNQELVEAGGDTTGNVKVVKF